jgi:hypothetical protein
MAKYSGKLPTGPSPCGDDEDCDSEIETNEVQPTFKNNILYWRKYNRIATLIKKVVAEAADLLEIDEKFLYIKETDNFIAIHINKDVDYALVKQIHNIVDREVDLKSKEYAEKESMGLNKKLRKIEEKVDTYSKEVENIKSLYNDIKPSLDAMSQLE